MPYATSDQTQIYYQTLGAGPAIVFAHGAGGNAGIWFEQSAHFANTYQCVAFDHRTFARSHCEDSSRVTPAQFRDDMLAVMDDLGISQAHLVGQSMGGYTVLRTARDNPERVLSLTMSCTPGGLPNPQPTAAVRGLLDTDSSGEGSGIADTMARASRVDAARMRLYEEINSFNTEFSWQNLVSLGAKENHITAADAAGIRCPVQFISGAEDPLFPPALLESYVPLFPNARFSVMENAGHSPYFEKPAEFNQLLQAFIESV